MNYFEGIAKITRPWMLLGLLLIGLLPALSAQTEMLSAKQSVQFALQHNTLIQRSKLETQKTQAKVREAISIGLPQVNGTGGFNYNAILATSFIPNIFQGKPEELVAVRFGTNYNTTFGAELDQLLYSQTFWTGIKATKELAQFNKLSEAKTAEDVAYNVVKLYYQVQTLSKQRDLVKANIEQVTGLYKATDLQYKNGLAKKIDVDQLRVNIVTLSAQRQNLDLQYEQAMQGLKFAMAMPLDAPIVLTDTLDGADLPVLASESDQTASYKNKIDLTLLDKQAQLLQLNTDVYKAGYFPTLSFRVNFNRQGQGNNIDQLKWFNNSVLGLNLQVPLFDGFKKSNQIQQASIERLQIIEDRKRTEQSLQLQYGNARQQLYSTLNTLTALKENGVVAQEVFNVTQKRFKEGLASINDVLQTERTMREVQTNYLTTLLQYRFALIDLDYANGKLMQLFN